MFTLHQHTASLYQVRQDGQPVFVGPRDDCLDFLAVVAPQGADAAAVYPFHTPPESYNRGRYLHLN